MRRVSQRHGLLLFPDAIFRVAHRSQIVIEPQYTIFRSIGTWPSCPVLDISHDDNSVNFISRVGIFGQSSPTLERNRYGHNGGRKAAYMASTAEIQLCTNLLIWKVVLQQRGYGQES
jgi:hypothetical protein